MGGSARVCMMQIVLFKGRGVVYKDRGFRGRAQAHPQNHQRNNIV